MKDFVRAYGRIAGIAAGAGFVLSILIGLLSRNPFGVALLRAILLGLFFGALGAGARFVFTKYLAEQTGETAGAAEGKTGQTIDITLPEEGPPAASRPRPAPSAEEAEPETLAEADEASSEEGAAAALSEPAAEGMEDALSDELPPLIEPEGEQSLDSGEEAGSEGVEEAESVAEEAPRGGPARAGADPEADAGLDTLPDISSLGVSSSGMSGEPQARPGRGMAAQDTPEDALRGKLGGQDPATLARAIRTVLKRDEKG